ncbi:MAG: hypothetical protein Q4D26_11305 [Clostridia bacterium]|nr:hypothetical protein [Clostridia bacterium]
MIGKYDARELAAGILINDKNVKNELNLRVYVKNTAAVNFYLREGFKITAEEIDDAAGEKEYSMKWYK